MKSGPDLSTNVGSVDDSKSGSIVFKFHYKLWFMVFMKAIIKADSVMSGGVLSFY